MNAKTTTVTLAVDNVTQEFEISHAERLLRITKAGWHILESSKYEFVNNAIRIKQDSKGNTGAKKRTIPTDCETAPKQD